MRARQSRENRHGDDIIPSMYVAMILHRKELIERTYVSQYRSDIAFEPDIYILYYRRW
jgi:hypothetical protein